MNHFLLIKESPGRRVEGGGGSVANGAGARGGGGETLLKFPESKRDGYKKVIGFVQ